MTHWFLVPGLRLPKRSFVNVTVQGVKLDLVSFSEQNPQLKPFEERLMFRIWWACTGLGICVNGDMCHETLLHASVKLPGVNYNSFLFLCCDGFPRRHRESTAQKLLKRSFKKNAGLAFSCCRYCRENKTQNKASALDSNSLPQDADCCKRGLFNQKGKTCQQPFSETHS